MICPSVSVCVCVLTLIWSLSLTYSMWECFEVWDKFGFLERGFTFALPGAGGITSSWDDSSYILHLGYSDHPDSVEFLL